MIHEVQHTTWQSRGLLDRSAIYESPHLIVLYYNMRRRRHHIALGLFIALVTILVLCSLPSEPPSFEFIPDEATIMRLPDPEWVVYEFPADFHSLIPKVTSELRNQGFVRTRVWYDPNDRQRFDRVRNGKEVVVEIHNKRLGKIGKAATEGEWVSVSINGGTVVNLKQRLGPIQMIRYFVWRLMQ